jgi:hypothetical protein
MPQSSAFSRPAALTRRRHHEGTLACGGRFGRFGIAEASDVVPIQQWVLGWNDLMSMEVHAALTDEQMAPLLAATVGK